jgi:diguanylate cyclase (GGDEF)-like protein/PAS domain S-box-containing protein
MNEATRSIMEQLASGRIPERIPADCDYAAELERLAEYFAAIQRFSVALGNGDLTTSLQGVAGQAAGGLKSLQASLRHLSWQTKQIACGDFSQRVDFMGDFAASFNSMVGRLSESRTEMERMNVKLQEELQRQREMAEALRESEERFRLITEKVNAVIWTMDAATLAFTYIGSYVTTLRGISVEEALAESIDQSMTPASLELLKDRIAHNTARFMDSGDVSDFYDSIEIEQICGDGRIIPVEMAISAITDHQGNLKEILGVSRDISSRKAAETELTYLSNHDSLTGLFNRTYFDNSFKRLLESGGFPLSIMVADLDGLKQVNDTLGHGAGDRMIKGAATILQMAFRGDDIIARIGGDEFAVLLQGMDRKEAETALARIRSCEESFNATQDGPAVRISIGTATALTGQDAAQAFREADARMYAEKALRKQLHV